MPAKSGTAKLDRRDWHVRAWMTSAASAIATSAVALAALASTAHGQPSGYPNKPIHLLVPYGPGGVGDQTMRLLANQVSQQIKQQIVIDNRPGAGGIVSMTETLRSPTDGYTLAQIGNGQAISMSLFNNLKYDTLRDFGPISVAGSFAILLVVNDRSPFKTVQQVVEAARKDPGKLNIGAINPGSTQNLSTYLLEQVTGVSYTVVPYRTSPELVTALLRGDVDVGFDYYAAFQAVIAPGKLRVIATTGDERDRLLQDVPTVKESGYPDYVVTAWNAIGSRAGVPDEITRYLNVEINRALAAPDLQQRFRAVGIEPSGSTREEMWERMARDSKKWRDVIEKAGIPKQGG
jgi:tripartite-type tricarboxylate transporter receptor subunit TctC